MENISLRSRIVEITNDRRDVERQLDAIKSGKPILSESELAEQQQNE